MAHAVQPLIGLLLHFSAGATGGVEGEAARRFHDVLDHVLVGDQRYALTADSWRTFAGATTPASSCSRTRQAQDRRVGRRHRGADGDHRLVRHERALPQLCPTGGLVVAVVIQISLAITAFVLLRRRDWL